MDGRAELEAELVAEEIDAATGRAEHHEHQEDDERHARAARRRGDGGRFVRGKNEGRGRLIPVVPPPAGTLRGPATGLTGRPVTLPEGMPRRECRSGDIGWVRFMWARPGDIGTVLGSTSLSVWPSVGATITADAEGIRMVDAGGWKPAGEGVGYGAREEGGPWSRGSPGANGDMAMNSVPAWGCACTCGCACGCGREGGWASAVVRGGLELGAAYWPEPNDWPDEAGPELGGPLLSGASMPGPR